MRRINRSNDDMDVRININSVKTLRGIWWQLRIIGAYPIPKFVANIAI